MHKTRKAACEGGKILSGLAIGLSRLKALNETVNLSLLATVGEIVSGTGF